MRTAAGSCIAIVGGGVAGLAAAAELAGKGLSVELYEARRHLGGRASSFYDEATHQWIDYCQHVSLGCCTELGRLFRRTGVADCFHTCRRLHFFAPDGRRYDLAPLSWLPAPLHLLPALATWGVLGWRERVALARALWRLVQCAAEQGPDTFGQWLAEQRQPTAVVERFWQPVLVSALGESVERIGFPQARKVFVDAFVASRTGLHMAVCRLPLREVLDGRLAAWLETRGVRLHRGAPVDRIVCCEQRGRWRATAVCAVGQQRPVDAVVVAASWRRAADFFEPHLAEQLGLAAAKRLEASPITGVHLWADRAITELHHAVLLGRLSQWVFRPAFAREDGTVYVEGRAAPAVCAAGAYHQVVISASRHLEGRTKEQIVADVWQDLCSVFPAARQARLLHSRVVTDPHAVFSPTPRNEQLRPPPRTPIPNLVLAGDWVQTGWPATMESAARSGMQAARILLPGPC